MWLAGPHATARTRSWSLNEECEATPANGSSRKRHEERHWCRGKDTRNPSFSLWASQSSRYGLRGVRPHVLLFVSLWRLIWINCRRNKQGIKGRDLPKLFVADRSGYYAERARGNLLQKDRKRDELVSTNAGTFAGAFCAVSLRFLFFLTGSRLAGCR